MPLRTFRSHPSPLYRLPGTLLVMIACALAVLLTAGLLAMFAWQDRVAAMKRANGVAANVSLLVAEHAARLIQIGDLTLRQAAELAAPPDPTLPDTPLPTDRATWRRLADLAVAAPQVVSIWIGDAEGNAALMSRNHPPPPLNAADRDYFQAARAGVGTPYVGRIEASRDGTGELLVLSRPLPAPPGVFRGFVTVTLSPHRLADLYRTFDIGYRTTVSLQRSDSTVLVRESGGAGTDDGEAITARRAVERYGLVAEVSIPLSSVRAEWLDRLGTYTAYGFGAMLVVIGIGMLAMQRARREREAEDALQHAYDTLEENVQRRTAELEDANHRLEDALADKEILLKEVQHRVSNNLQVICSLLRLQAARLDDRSRVAFDESLRRIQSMSLVHELLYRSAEPAHINVAEYLRQLCDTLARASGPTPVRVTVEAEDWILDVDRAMPLALIASELVSNALRHAFPDGHAGSVVVDLRPGPAGVRMEVRDDGVGLPADLPATPVAGRRRGGLGLVLVQSLAKQANADMQIERSPGTRFTITIPNAASLNAKGQAEAEAA